MLELTVLVLPGFNGTDGLVEPFVRAAPANYRVVTVTYPTDRATSYEALRELVRGRISAIDGPFVIVGESYAGPLAVMLTEPRPPGLIAVVLVGAFIKPPHAAVARWLPWDAGFKLMRPVYALRRLLPNVGPRRANLGGVLRRGARELRQVEPHVLAARMRSLFQVDASVWLRECPVPILYCRGERDLVVPAHNLEEIVRIRPSVSVRYFDTGHFMLQERPQ